MRNRDLETLSNGLKEKCLSPKQQPFRAIRLGNIDSNQHYYPLPLSAQSGHQLFVNTMARPPRSCSPTSYLHLCSQGLNALSSSADERD
jgi:hypothetical protein